MRGTNGSIDRADWHYGGDYPNELPKENGGTHIGMYINWIIDNGLIGETHLKNSEKGIKDVKDRKITGRDFLFQYCDEKFWEEDLNEEGLAFTRYYYQNQNDPEEQYGEFIDDYLKILGTEFKSLYEIPNSWDNYTKISQQINKAYKKWKRRSIKKPWQFWKNNKK
ncbi:MAG: hypothetical protein RJQ09_00220 [Cyclobacteriaceae bacterium]